MRLDFELSCGIAPIRISGNDFEMGLRTCVISLGRANCEVCVGSSYEHWLELGTFKASEVHKTTSGSSAGISAGLNVEADATKGVANLAAKLGLGASKKRSANTEKVTKQNARIELVVTSGPEFLGLAVNALNSALGFWDHDNYDPDKSADALVAHYLLLSLKVEISRRRRELDDASQCAETLIALASKLNRQPQKRIKGDRVLRAKQKLALVLKDKSQADDATKVLRLAIQEHLATSHEVFLETPSWTW